jgi:hypothetical protein
MQRRNSTLGLLYSRSAVDSVVMTVLYDVSGSGSTADMDSAIAQSQRP